KTHGIPAQANLRIFRRPAVEQEALVDEPLPCSSISFGNDVDAGVLQVKAFWFDPGDDVNRAAPADPCAQICLDRGPDRGRALLDGSNAHSNSVWCCAKTTASPLKMVLSTQTSCNVFITTSAAVSRSQSTTK